MTLWNRSPSARGTSETALHRGRPERFRAYGFAAWFRADLGITIGTGVSAWADQSGSGHHITQATGANQPALVASSTPTGRPGIAFDGSDDMLAATFTANQPVTVAVTFKTTPGTPSIHDAIYDGGTNLSTSFFVDTTPQTYIYSGAIAIAAGVINSGVYGYMLGQHSGATSFWRNNGTLGAAADSGANNAGGLTLGALNGGTRAAVCTIAEVIMFAGGTVLSTSAINRLDNYRKAWAGL